MFHNRCLPLLLLACWEGGVPQPEVPVLRELSPPPLSLRGTARQMSWAAAALSMFVRNLSLSLSRWHVSSWFLLSLLSQFVVVSHLRVFSAFRSWSSSRSSDFWLGMSRPGGKAPNLSSNLELLLWVTMPWSIRCIFGTVTEFRRQFSVTDCILILELPSEQQLEPDITDEAPLAARRGGLGGSARPPQAAHATCTGGALPLMADS